ncbi:MAG: hypothetical protein AB1304_00285 [Bacteroidota bacterium]
MKRKRIKDSEIHNKTTTQKISDAFDFIEYIVQHPEVIKTIPENSVIIIDNENINKIPKKKKTNENNIIVVQKEYKIIK